MSTHEKRTLVTSFESLKAGDLVDLEDCGWCDGIHRMQLIRFESDRLVAFPDDDGDDDDDDKFDVWHSLPAFHGEYGKTALGIFATDVEDRVVYLIDTGLESTQETHSQVKKPKAVRA